MLTLPAFRSRFSWARFERIELARLSASILWSSDLSGAALEVWTGAFTGRQYIPGSRERKEDLGLSDENFRLSGFWVLSRM